ncbi:hypothetical protein JCGZ_11481 [Jatropha curcas]|uniref:DYW domain-containing protein n=1 Tax=Jatropha curcas TaxID=180498 RepID=A0A067KFS1_JATCU|nr:pentatricopeptide repeat-containing protein At1g05750, chloroplastic [Jatropha curcas]XP_012080074.1 pentatricopeptide repeat-containing protein At1g05750, chloroplastic [Jatropha curcas]XP_037496181.1 pentatricopeptide repeat-containing protein At1g05750, chloroplastic [Jatropha curcas]KDP31105.1 hypothetical protein JCGZ_11481 [Jatropha curcas]
METVRSVNPKSLPLHAHCNDQHRRSVQYKVAIYSPNHVVSGTKNPAISCSFRNSFFASFPFSNNQLQKSSDIRGFFSSKPIIDISLVNSKIKECTDNGFFEDAIVVYLNLLECGFPVEKFQFFPCLIKAVGGLLDITMGKEIHGHLLKLGVLEDIYIKNSLLGMYWKCGAVRDAVKMFEKMERRDLVSWNSMISGFCQSGGYANSLMRFSWMIREVGGIYLNRVACLSALSSCASLKFLSCGKEIHGFLVKSGLDFDEFLVGGLIDMYMKCGDIKNAEHVFKRSIDEELVRENRVVWNVIILGYVSNECLSLAWESFTKMLELGINPDSSTLVAILVLLSQSLNLAVGKQIHGIIHSFGLESDIRVVTALMEMYFKCGDPETGLKIFRQSQNYNLVMWGSVISNCAQHDYSNAALQLFQDFLLEYRFPDSVILLAALRACSSLVLKPKGMEIHGLAVKLGFDSDIFVGGALVDLYGKCGDMESAQEVFYRLPTRDLVSWNALISGFAQNEYADKALREFRNMQSEQIKPNTVTVACILSVCAHLSVIVLCKELHCYLLRHGFEFNILVSNSLISTYAKCGDVNSSWTVFDKMPARDEVSWNSIMLCFGMHGHTDKMFALFEKMKEAGMKPDHATFTAVLSACSHAGKVEMGWKYFDSMVKDYNLDPRVEQYTCMIDLLGRAGHLDEAYNLIMAMSCSPDDRVWGSLLGSCKSHGDVKLAEVVANHIFELDPNNIGYRVLLANLYEDSGKLNEVTQVRTEIKCIGVKKQPGCSWIEVNNGIHIFIASDSSHSQSEIIYATIENLTLEMRRLGYVPHLLSATIGPDEAEVKEDHDVLMPLD